MEHTASAAQPPAAQEPSTGDLVKQLSEQVSVLVRDELKLAQLEMTRKGKQAGLGIGMLGGSGLVALYAVACLLACVIIAISGVVAAWLCRADRRHGSAGCQRRCRAAGEGAAAKGRASGPRTGRRQRQG